MAQIQDSLIDTVFDGRYRILRRLGAGGMANVYLAEDAELGRRVAIKILNERYANDDLFVERFRREAKSAAALSHPNIVSIYDRGEAEGTYYIAMEVIEGRSLKESIRMSGRLRPAQAIAYARQILAALRFAHRNGIVHRDIKPHNILIGPEERLKVTDFGIARAGASQMTEAGSIMGTAQYLSPEQARGGDVAPPSDLYSVGVVLYEMLTGEVPFVGDSPVEIAMKHVNDPPRPPSARAPGIPADLDRIVLRSLAKNPAERYQTAEEMDSDLARIEAGLPVARETAEAATAVLAGATAATAATQVLQPHPASPRQAPPGRRPPYDPYSDRKRRRRSFLPWLVVALLLAAFAAAGYYIYRQIDERLEEAAPVAVPNVEGLVQARAVERLEADGFEVNVERQPSSEVDKNVVIDQDPEGGAKIEQGSTVVIVVSSGLPQVEVPRVVGLQLQEATSRLSDRNLEWRVREVFSEQDPGIVLRQNPTAGEQVAEGTVIELRVSKGQNLIDVPNVVGQEEGTATQILTDAGFEVSSTPVFSDQTPGTVVAQTPNGGQAIKGSTVEIQVSQGVELVTVPGVIGLSEADAAAALQAAGFGVNVEDLLANSAEEDGIVLNQDPGEGGQVEPGSTITIYVGRFTEPEPEPPPPPAEPPPPDQGEGAQAGDQGAQREG
jgi:serine/threonine-protein kinase